MTAREWLIALIKFHRLINKAKLDVHFNSSLMKAKQKYRGIFEVQKRQVQERLLSPFLVSPLVSQMFMTSPLWLVVGPQSL